MKKMIILAGLMLTITSCVSKRQIVHTTPHTVREAVVYEDHVVVITKTKVSREHFDQVMAKRNKID